MTDESDDLIRARAAEVGARPDVARWVARFRKLAKDMPPDVAVFCESGSPFVMVRSEGGEGYVNGHAQRGHEGCENQAAIIAQITPGPHGGGWDGGGW